MLLRLANHGLLNPHLIDKLIVIKGLPHDWIFKTVTQGEQLLPPWEPDIDANIPESIRHLCTPITYCKWFPDVRHYDKTYTGFWDTKTTFGLILDCNRGPAQEMWNRISEYIEGTIPRTERMPFPVLVAKDQKSMFSPHLSRRDGEGHLQLVPSSIPVVDLVPYQVPVKIVQNNLEPITSSSSPESVFEENASGFRCDSCNYSTGKERALRMHKMKKHPAKEKVAV